MHNNRLVRYEVREETSKDLLRTVWFTYYKTGRVSNIVLMDIGAGARTM